MANRFKATGGSVAILPTTSWAAPANLFPTTVENGGGIYSIDAATSTVTLPSSDLADGYLLLARYEFEDTSNGRCNPQGQFIQTSGTGTFGAGPTGGYNRDNSEDRSYVHALAFVDNPSASATFQFQWKRDTDTPTGGTVRSSIEIIPFYYDDIGIYTSTNASAYGGTTPNQVTGFSGTDGTGITLSANVVTAGGNNKPLLVFGSQFFEGRGGRTQRWHGIRVNGTKDDAVKAYSYYRNGNNDESGDLFTFAFPRSASTITFDQFCYRGDGVANGQGGADIDGSTPSVGSHLLVVMELRADAELFAARTTTDSSNLSTSPTILDVNESRDFIDTASFTNVVDSSINCVKTADYLFGANISIASNNVSATGRFTGYAELSVNGTADTTLFGGDYLRNNQGTTDTFGLSANLIGAVSLTAGDDVGITYTELAGSEGQGNPISPAGWSGFWGVNLDTLEGSAVVIHNTTGALSGTTSSITGSASRIDGPVTHITSGNLVNSAASINGSANRFRTHSTSGIIAGLVASIVGSASRANTPVTHATSGVLSGLSSSIVGSSSRSDLNTVTLIDQTNNIIFQRNITASGQVIFSASHSGPTTVDNLRVQLYEDDGTTIAQAWTELTSPIIGPSFSIGTLTVPIALFMYRFAIQTRDSSNNVLATSNVSVNLWGLGDNIAINGDSDVSRLLENSSASGLTPNAAVRLFNGTSWTTFGTDGSAISIANAHSADQGCAVGIINVAQSGSRVQDWGNSGSSQWALLETAAANMGTVANISIFCAGANDATGNLTDESVYTTNYTAAYGHLRTLFGANHKIVPLLTSRNDDGGGSLDAAFTASRKVMFEMSEAQTDTLIPVSGMDLPMAFFHYTDAANSYPLLANRLSEATIAAVSGGDYRGPYALGYSISGSVATMSVNRDLGTNLTANANSGYVATDNSGSLSISSVSVFSPTSITISFGRSPVGTVLISYGLGEVPYSAGEGVNDNSTYTQPFEFLFEMQQSSSSHASTGTLSAEGSSIVGSAELTTPNANRTRISSILTLGLYGPLVNDIIPLGYLGSVSHNTIGVLEGQSSSVIGTASNITIRQSFGSLVGQGSAISGIAERATAPHVTSGVLSAQGSSVSGNSDRSRENSTSGALVGQGSVITGTANSSTPRPSNGVLVGQNSEVSGSANRVDGPMARTRLSSILTLGLYGPLVNDIIPLGYVSDAAVIHDTSGVLQGQNSVITGSANRFAAHNTSGILQGQGSNIDGAAQRLDGSHITAGVLQGQSSNVTGNASRLREHTTNGILQGQSSSIVGTSEKIGQGHDSSGILQGSESSIVGSSAHIAKFNTIGVLEGQSANIVGSAERIAGPVTHETTGVLLGQSSRIEGFAERPDPTKSTIKSKSVKRSINRVKTVKRDVGKKSISRSKQKTSINKVGKGKNIGGSS